MSDDAHTPTVVDYIEGGRLKQGGSSGEVIIDLTEQYRECRNAAIEECALVAESWHIQKALWPRDASDISSAIRALKDKT